MIKIMDYLGALDVSLEWCGTVLLIIFIVEKVGLNLHWSLTPVLIFFFREFLHRRGNSSELISTAFWNSPFPKNDIVFSFVAIPTRNVTATLHFGTRAYLFSPEEGSCYVFWPERIVTSFLHHMVLLFNVLLNHKKFKSKKFGKNILLLPISVSTVVTSILQ